MPSMNLTARKVASLPIPSSGQVDYFDTNLPGFGVRVSYGGRKTWIVMYRAGKTKRRMKIGTAPPMDLADARERAKAALVKVQDGNDPAVEKLMKRTAETFKELAELYLQKYAKPNKKSWKIDEKVLTRDAIPQFGSRRAAEINRRDIRQLVNDIVERGSPIQANRTFEIVRKLFNWAISEDYLTSNPCDGLSKPAKENRRDRVLKEDEIRSVWKAFELEADLVSTIFKLRLVTAQRGSEVASMRWEDLDLNAQWWTIPAERAKNGLSHRVPLSNLALSLIDDLRMDADGLETGWVFPGPRPGMHLEYLVHASRRVRDRSNVDFVPHDLRRTAASFMTGMGIPRLTVSKILNHVERDVTATYDRHSYDNEKRLALETWANKLNSLLLREQMASNILDLNRA